MRRCGATTPSIRLDDSVDSITAASFKAASNSGVWRRNRSWRPRHSPKALSEEPSAALRRRSSRKVDASEVTDNQGINEVVTCQYYPIYQLTTPFRYATRPPAKPRISSISLGGN